MSTELEAWENNREVISLEAKAERLHQLNKWGPQAHALPVWATILSEEVGELSQEILRIQFGESDAEDVLREALQVAAVALAIAQFAKYGKPA